MGAVRETRIAPRWRAANPCDYPAIIPQNRSLGLGQVPPAGASCARAPIAAGARRATCASGRERPSRCPQADRGARARLAALLRPPEPRAAFIRNGVRRTPLVERFPTFRIFSLGLHTKERVLPVDRQWTARPRCRTRRRSASPGTGRAGTRRRCPAQGLPWTLTFPGREPGTDVRLQAGPPPLGLQGWVLVKSPGWDRGSPDCRLG